MKTTINLVKPVMITPPTSLMKTWTITLACLFGAFGSAVNASTIINESFDSWPVTDWVASHSAGVASASVSGENRLNIFRAAVDGVGGSGVYYTGSQGEVVNGEILDFDMEVTMRFGGSSSFNNLASIRGVAFRTQTLDRARPVGETGFWGYVVGVNTRNTDGVAAAGLYLFENPTNFHFENQGTQLGFDGFSANLSDGIDYILQLSVHEKNISASLWNADKSIELASISYSNAVEEAGYFGLRSVYPNSGLNTYYNDLSLTVIPEWNAPAI